MASWGEGRRPSTSIFPQLHLRTLLVGRNSGRSMSSAMRGRSSKRAPQVMLLRLMLMLLVLLRVTKVMQVMMSAREGQCVAADEHFLAAGFHGRRPANHNNGPMEMTPGDVMRRCPSSVYMFASLGRARRGRCLRMACSTCLGPLLLTA